MDHAEHSLFEGIYVRARRKNRDALGPTLELAVEIAREGREGRRIGTLFTVGDAETVLEHSRPLILDPIAGHPDEVKHVLDDGLRGTIKELAQLDGAFVVSEEGIVVSACRYLETVVGDVDIPLGLGSRHLAAASITHVTGATAVVVSESSMVRVFDRGTMIGEIIPELWILSRYDVRLRSGENDPPLDPLVELG